MKLAAGISKIISLWSCSIICHVVKGCARSRTAFITKHASFQDTTPTHDLPFAFFPLGASPFPTVPDSFRSIYQLAVSPDLFFNVNANILLPCFMASFRSASLDCNDSLMASKASDEGKASAESVSGCRFGGANALSQTRLIYHS